MKRKHLLLLAAAIGAVACLLYLVSISQAKAEDYFAKVQLFDWQLVSGNTEAPPQL